MTDRSNTGWAGICSRCTTHSPRPRHSCILRSSGSTSCAPGHGSHQTELWPMSQCCCWSAQVRPFLCFVTAWTRSCSPRSAVCDSDERNKECSNYDNCPALSVPGRCQVSSLIIRNAGKLEEVQTNTDTHTKTRQSC